MDHCPFTVTFATVHNCTCMGTLEDSSHSAGTREATVEAVIQNVFQSQPSALWICGSAASGKSRIADAVLRPFGFDVLDVDAHYERLATEYRDRLGPERTFDNYDRRAVARFDRVAQRLVAKLASSGRIETREFIEHLMAEGAIGGVDTGAAARVSAEVRERIGERLVDTRTLHAVLWPRMDDFADPKEYLNGRRIVTRQLLVVARELLKRQIQRARAAKRNIARVETGGQLRHLLRCREELQADGYRALLVWVALSSEELAQRRNALRGDTGGRALPAALIARSFVIAQRVRPLPLATFSPDVIELDNSEEGETALCRVSRQLKQRFSAWFRQRPSTRL